MTLFGWAVSVSGGILNGCVLATPGLQVAWSALSGLFMAIGLSVLYGSAK